MTLVSFCFYAYFPEDWCALFFVVNEWFVCGYHGQLYWCIGSFVFIGLYLCLLLSFQLFKLAFVLCMSLMTTDVMRSNEFKILNLFRLSFILVFLTLDCT